MDTQLHYLGIIGAGLVLALALAVLPTLGDEPAATSQPATDNARRFIADYESKVRPLQIAEKLADWKAQASGKDEDYRADEQALNRLNDILSDRARFAALKRIRDELGRAGVQTDPLLRRQIELLYLESLGKQVDPELLKRMTAKATAITQAFNVYRAEVGGKKLAESEVDWVLKESRDTPYRREVWEASKAVGRVVEKNLKELVELRNQAARQLGFKDYYDMQLQCGEMSREQVLRIFDELHELTAGLFRETKARIDARLAADFGIGANELRPWHYHDRFFQEIPDAYGVDFDSFYARADVVKLAGDFYAGIGLPLEDVIDRSDLYERPGKYPHAMCMDMDRGQDVRVMANAVPNATWAATMLHEFGHASYDKYLPSSLPYAVHAPAHEFTTEAVAMLFERLARQPSWMKAMGISVADPAAVAKAAAESQRDATLIFEAWAQVMVRFESAMYADPQQNLNKLWWDLVEKYQLIHRPDGRNAPDYASKIHIVTTPAYYHSYMIGEMFVSQLHATICREVLKTDDPYPVYAGRKEIGEYMKSRVFAPGASVRWDELVRQATGEELSPKAMMKELTATK